VRCWAGVVQRIWRVRVIAAARAHRRFVLIKRAQMAITSACLQRLTRIFCWITRWVRLFAWRDAQAVTPQRSASFAVRISRDGGGRRDGGQQQYRVASKTSAAYGSSRASKISKNSGYQRHVVGESGVGKDDESLG